MANTLEYISTWVGVFMNYREFRNRFRLIPFGKFSISGKGKSPFNQVYVGRAKERAAFIELLTHQEQFGSFLVSGRRGSGKTSFVEYALSEYRQSSFHRYIRFARNSSFQDFLIAAFLGMFISTLAVIFAQSTELLAQNAFLSLHASERPFSGLTWTWFPLIILSTLSFGLLFYAKQGVSAATMNFDKGSKRRRKFASWSILMLVFLYVFVGDLFWFKQDIIGFLSNYSLDFRIFMMDGFEGGVVACLLFLISVATSNIVFNNIRKQLTIKKYKYKNILLKTKYFGINGKKKILSLVIFFIYLVSLDNIILASDLIHGTISVINGEMLLILACLTVLTVTTDFVTSRSKEFSSSKFEKMKEHEISLFQTFRLIQFFLLLFYCIVIPWLFGIIISYSFVPVIVSNSFWMHRWISEKIKKLDKDTTPRVPEADVKYYVRV